MLKIICLNLFLNLVFSSTKKFKRCNVKRTYKPCKSINFILWNKQKEQKEIPGN
jgi:hypothetical protein